MEHNLKPTYFREYNCSMQIGSQTTNILILTQTEFIQSIKHIAQARGELVAAFRFLLLRV
jgi:hypothetical protein